MRIYRFTFHETLTKEVWVAGETRAQAAEDAVALSESAGPGEFETDRDVDMSMSYEANVVPELVDIIGDNKVWSGGPEGKMLTADEAVLLSKEQEDDPRLPGI